MECTTDAYSGCLCCYLLHQHKKYIFLSEWRRGGGEGVVRDSCTYKKRVKYINFYQYWTTVFFYFIHFFLARREVKKGKFLLSAAVLLTTTLNQRDWNWKSNEMRYIQKSRHHAKAYDNREIFSLLFMYCTHIINFMQPTHSRCYPLSKIRMMHKNRKSFSNLRLHALFTHFFVMCMGWLTHTHAWYSSSSSCVYVCFVYVVCRVEKGEKRRLFICFSCIWWWRGKKSGKYKTCHWKMRLRFL